MNVATIADVISTPVETEAVTPALTNTVGFERLLQRASQKVRELSGILVADTFVKPLLAQLRRDPFRTDLFHGGFAEDVFAAQLNTVLAERITTKAKLPIVDTVHRKFMKAMQNYPERIEGIAYIRLDLIG